jgi:acyl-CoA thioester hydrolase
LTKFSWPVRIYWEDTDAGGIVFYANYLKFFERARTEWLRSLGVVQHELRERTGGMFVVSDTRTRHLAPARLDDELRVTAELVHTGRAVLELRQQAFRGADQTLLCEATIRIAWVLAHSLKPSRIPATLLQRLAAAHTSKP